ncbi:MAG: GNAT family acetyltransferase [Chloroflexi bacterium]|nr:GNAT family acetyltransferase [Chloroflexota bacterium]
MEIRPFESPDENSVVDLWHRCGLVRSWNDPRQDIARKRSVQPDLFLVAVEEDRVVGTVMAGYEGHRGWVNYLAVDADHRRTGIGRALMDEAQERLGRLGCPKVNLQVRSDNGDALAFYDRIGFARDDVVSLGKRLERD